MAAADILGLMVPLTYLVMLGVEKIAPARAQPQVRGWGWIGALFLVVSGVIQSVTPLLIPPDWLASHRLFDLGGLGPVWGAMLGYLVLSFVSFVWHWSAHHFGLMWRAFHQLHHAPHRVDISGAMVFHPLEQLAFALMGVAVTTLLLGLDPLAAGITGYVAAFYSLFQHWNVRTPRWMGLFIQRPEAHAAHHERGVHARNYADFPLWDMIFGSYFNPRSFEGEAGFDAPAQGRYLAMLGFVDVNAPVNARLGRRAAGLVPDASPTSAPDSLLKGPSAP